MNRRHHLIFLIISCFVCLSFATSALGYDLVRERPLPIPSQEESHPSLWSKGEANFCFIQYDHDSISWYYPEFGPNEGIAILMDPAAYCGFDSTYPFKISYVDFYLFDPESVFTWPAEIRIGIRDLYIAEDTLMPGDRRHYEDFSVPQDFAYHPVNNPFPISAQLGEVVCVDTAFVIEITYRVGAVGTNPSLIMSDTLTDRPDTNRSWLLKSGDYMEWYDAWTTTPGRAIIRVTGYPYAIDCDKLCWKWLPEETKAPSGLPDFDQYQFGPDSVAMSAPVAMADVLVWLNAIPSIADPDSLIRSLSYHFHTDPLLNGGTLTDSVKSGLDFLFSEYGLNLRDTVVVTPTFRALADSVKNSIGAALLIGFWQRIGDVWYRIGGHYVGAAGACKNNLWVAVSDPGLDNAEVGGRGRFLPPHEIHVEDHTLHNTQGFVSHDAYLCDTLSVGPYAEAWILRDLMADSLPWVGQFEGLNFQPGQDSPHSYDPAESLYAVVEYAIMILEKPTLVEEEATTIPRQLELFQSYPNPFNNQTVIRYSLSRSIEVSLIVYNILGQRVKTLVEEEIQSGLISVAWDGKDDEGKDVSSGIYFYRLQAGEISETKRMVLLK